MIEVDDREVMAMFEEMSPKNRKRVITSALRRSGNILVRQTRKNLRSVTTKSGALNTRTPNKWNGRKMEQGVRIKVKVDNKTKEAKIHILGDFRLKFFELGTSERYTKKKGAYRGRIEGYNFFKAAKEQTEKKIFSEMDKVISEQVKKVNAKYK